MSVVPIFPADDAKRDGYVDYGQLYAAGFALYDAGGYPPGTSTGWPVLDVLYTVARGQVTVVTGVPGMGKSEFVDALLVNLAEHDPRWFFGIYSPENWPCETHLAKLVEKRIRLPFGKGVTARMSRQQYADGAAWVMRHFLWLDPQYKTPLDLIDTALKFNYPARNIGIVLDPWNTLDHERGGLNETDYVSKVLTKVSRLAKESNAHIWLVAHPTKIAKDRDGIRPIPTPYDINGSAHWYNKADNIMTVHRDQSRPNQDVDIHVQKVRFKHIGHGGLVTLKYDKVTGRYFDMGTSGAPGEFYADPERGLTPPDAESAAERVALREV